MKWSVESWFGVPNLYGDGGMAVTVFKGDIMECLDYARKNYSKFLVSEEELNQIFFQALELMDVWFWLDDKRDNLGLMLDEENDYDLLLSKADEFWEQAGEENRL